MAGGLTKKERVTNVEITPENNTVGVSARGGERLILMRITNPRHTPLLTLCSRVCGGCEHVSVCVRACL